MSIKFHNDEFVSENSIRSGDLSEITLDLRRISRNFLDLGLSPSVSEISRNPPSVSGDFLLKSPDRIEFSSTILCVESLSYPWENEAIFGKLTN